MCRGKGDMSQALPLLVGTLAIWAVAYIMLKKKESNEEEL